MTSKYITRSSSTVVAIVAFIAILVAFNVIFSRNPWRRDLTRDKLFTISEATKKFLTKMNDDVNITLYTSQNLPPQLIGSHRMAKDYLQELTALAGGKINLRVETPPDDKKTEEELAQKGIRKLQVNVVQKDEQKVAAVYYHLYLEHLDKNLALPIPSGPDMEYTIASSLLQVTQREKPVIAVVMNDANYQFEQVLEFLQDRLGLGERFDVRPISLKKDQDLNIPKDTKTLVLMKPKDFSETDLYKIDQFVMNGGTLLVYASTLNLLDREDRMAMFRAQPRPNIYPLLDSYGLKVNSDLVSDYKWHHRRVVPVQQSRGFMLAQIEYPQWPIVRNENFEKDNPALGRLQALLMPYPNSISLEEKLPEGVKSYSLIKTSQFAKAQEKPPFDLQPPKPEEFESEPKDGKQFLLAAAVAGPLDSHYKGKEKPKKAEDANKDKKEDDPLAAMQRKEEEDAGEKQDKGKAESRVIVITGADLFGMEMLRGIDDQALVQQSIVFYENMLDWTTLGTDLIDIRTRPVTVNRLRDKLTDDEKSAAKFQIRFLMPIVVALVGLAWWGWRRSQLKRYAQVYAS